jgi:hypothetical protein
MLNMMNIRLFIFCFSLFISNLLLSQEAVGMTESAIRAEFPYFNFKVEYQAVEEHKIKSLAYSNPALQCSISHVLNNGDRCLLSIFTTSSEAILKNMIESFNKQYIVISNKQWKKYKGDKVITIDFIVRDGTYAFMFEEK